MSDRVDPPRCPLQSAALDSSARKPCRRPGLRAALRSAVAHQMRAARGREILFDVELTLDSVFAANDNLWAVFDVDRDRVNAFGLAIELHGQRGGGNAEPFGHLGFGAAHLDPGETFGTVEAREGFGRLPARVESHVGKEVPVGQALGPAFGSGGRLEGMELHSTGADAGAVMVVRDGAVVALGKGLEFFHAVDAETKTIEDIFAGGHGLLHVVGHGAIAVLLGGICYAADLNVILAADREDLIGTAVFWKPAAVVEPKARFFAQTIAGFVEVGGVDRDVVYVDHRGSVEVWD